MKNIKIFCLFVIISVLICGNLISCKDSADNNTDNTSDNSDNGGMTETESATEAPPDIPVIDMNGKEITILTAGWGGWVPMAFTDIAPEEYNGDPLNDAAYDRKMKIEEAYNCKITLFADNNSSPDADGKKLQQSVLAGEHMYDIALMRGMNFTTFLTNNYLLDLSRLENVDFDNPWWRKDCSDALRIGGKQYGVSGNISSVEITMTTAIVFNKSIVNDYSLESPYELVKSGDWTLDKMIEQAKQVTRDLDGDSVMTDLDMWGISYGRDNVWNLLNGCGVNMIELDSEGFPRMTIDAGDNLSKIQNILIKLFDESYSANGRRYMKDGSIVLGFTNGNVLFEFTFAGVIAQARGSEVDLGILPLPKYDNAQTDYLPAPYGLGVPIICVPSTNTDMENTGLFLEAFSYEGQKSVIPVFYENTLKVKSTRDSESEEMLDYIFENIHYDTGTLLNFDNFTQSSAMMAESLDTNIASFVERNKAKCEGVIQQIMDEIRAEL
jgi:hypothetical protein